MTANGETGGGPPGIPIRIQVLTAPFDSCAEQAALIQGRHRTGALVTFVGLMRDLLDDGHPDGDRSPAAPDPVPDRSRAASDPVPDQAPDAAPGMSDIGRGDRRARPPDRMILEHYPGMTEKALTAIAERAARRWDLDAISILHRVGTLAPGDPIVFVGVASRHRSAAFRACEFLIDYLKTQAPFWKKECGAVGERWVAARDTDRQAEERWRTAGD